MGVVYVYFLGRFVNNMPSQCLCIVRCTYAHGMCRCPRCVACPICTSPLEKIVYAFSTATSAAGKEKEQDKDKEQEQDKGSGDKDTKILKQSRDTYLYQCPFCFWSSDTVSLRASAGQDLLENLSSMIKKPIDEGT